MKKKLLVVSLLVVFTLVAISLASAINTGTAKSVERKDSPLFGIRTRRAIGDKLQELRESIKTRFIGERVFFLPFQRLRNIRNIINERIGYLNTCTDCGYAGCDETWHEDCTWIKGCTSVTCDNPTSPDTCDQFTCYYWTWKCTCNCDN